MVARRKYLSIRIRGVTYGSVAAAAAALNVSTGLVYKAIGAGTLDRVGLVPAQGGPPKMPIAIRGEVFQTARDAARHFGITQAAIYQALHDQNPDRIGRGTRAPPANARPITILGRTWPSRAALSRALGHGPSYVHVALSRGRTAAVIEQVMALALRQDAAARVVVDEVTHWRKKSAEAAGQPARAGAGCRKKRAA